VDHLSARTVLLEIAGIGNKVTSPDTFAFIKFGEFSHTNEHVLTQLRMRFPGLSASVVDVGDMHVIGKRNVPRLILSVAREYGLSACASAERLRRHIAKTRYAFLRARAALLQHLHAGKYAFTFQTQSLFDASCPGTPHFIYTDHTPLENLQYPAQKPATPISRDWVELEKGAYHNARIVFTMSSNISRSLVQEYGCLPQRVKCVYAGSNVSAEPTEIIDSGRFHSQNILFVGVDWERKGGPALLEAFRSVRCSHPRATLTIVGCSPQINEPGVRVEGRVPLHEVAQHYRSASIFCLPTLNEPFGLVILEAFSYGLPVVATRLGAIPEIVTNGKSGYLVAPHNSAQLAEALGKLLADPARCAQFGAYGRLRAAQRYSWEATGQKLAAHIERAARVRPGTSLATASSPDSVPRHVVPV
jgi:glycosyltransferase involved in cell wall biosynthesis